MIDNSNNSNNNNNNITTSSNYKQQKCLVAEVINDFCLSIEGSVLRKGSNEYRKSLLKRWNLDVDNSPELIVFPKNVNDVVKAINFSREYELDVAIKSGGHGISSACVDGLLIDFCNMKEIKVDPINKIVRVESGCTLGNLDDETSKYGLHIPSGHVSHTGLAGLTLGGGIGHLSRSLGLTSDNLIECTMVNYKGEILKVNQETNLELLYGIRGAGSNFGVVTEFVFELHPVNNVYLGTFVYSHDNCKDALVQLGKLASEPTTPNELSCAISITPEGVAVMAIYNGTEDSGKEIIETISKFGSPIVSNISSIPYVMLQKVIDDKVPHGLKYYQRGPFIKDPLNKEIVDIVIDSYNAHPTKSGAILLTHLGGKVKTTPREFSSFAHRDAEYQIILLSIIPSDEHKPVIKQWTVDTHSKLSKYCFGDYSNTTDGSQPMTVVYGDCYNKLVELKNKYDPFNFFHNNANIKPTINK